MLMIGKGMVMRTEVLQVYGMVCYACTDILENAVTRVQGVVKAEVNYMMDVITISYDEAMADMETILKAAIKAGYRLEKEDRNDETGKKWKQMRRERKKDLRTKILTVFACSVLLNSMKYLLPVWGKLFLGTIVQIIVIKEFYKDAGNGIANRKGNMSLLIAIGATAGYLYSCCALFFSYSEKMLPCFENIAAIVTIVLIGRFIELGARMESVGNIRRLTCYRSEKANVLQNGKITCVRLSELCPGMKFLIRRGEKVPVDGKILEGFVSLDESVITGEYYPVEKSPGESVTGAGYVIDGYAVCEVEKKPDQCLVYQLMEAAASAMSGKKLSVITYVDHLMEYFVPVVLLVAVVTLFLWYGIFSPGNIQKAMECALAVLLVACPCAMSLSVPLSVVHTVGCAAGHGIFIREEGKLEQIGKMKRIVFDKTGTLTTGEIVVRRFWCNGAEADQVLQILHETEKYSVHPIARAIFHFTDKYQCEDDSCKIFEFKELEGGIKAKSKEVVIWIGKREFIESHTGKCLKISGVDDYEKVFFSVGDVEGYFELEDKVRDDVVEAINRIRKLGLDIAVISGDRAQNITRLSEILKIKDVFGNLTPKEKEIMIKQWEKEQGVIMVGDGFNDLPGILQSEVGIAMGCGCDVLKECADIIIGSNQIDKLPDLISLSRAMKKNIYQNLLWAFSYNTVGIIMAVSGVLNPLLAGFAMSFSSIAVIWNAGRMKKIGNKLLENF